MSVWSGGWRSWALRRGAVRRDTTVVPNGYAVVSTKRQAKAAQSKASQYQLPVYFKWKSRRSGLVSIEEVGARCRCERTEWSQQASGWGNESKGGSDKVEMKPQEEGRQANV
jgi:hypothetical protein